MESMQPIVDKLIEKHNLDKNYREIYQKIITYPKIKDFLSKHQDKISKEILENSLSKLNEFMREDMAIQAGRSGSNPGYAPELYFQKDYIDVRYLPTKEYLETQKVKKQRAKLDNRMMSRDVRDATLEKYDINTSSRALAMQAVVEFIQQYKNNPNQAQGLFLHGSFGIGKTYLLGALANDLVSTYNVSVTILHYPTFINQLKSTFADNTTNEQIDFARQTDILIIDDIGAESNSGWARDDVLAPILEYRMKESLPTFFTSNFNLDQLLTHLENTKASTDKLKARRIMERIRYLTKEIKLEGPNRRQFN